MQSRILPDIAHRHIQVEQAVTVMQCRISRQRFISESKVQRQLAILISVKIKIIDRPVQCGFYQFAILQ